MGFDGQPQILKKQDLPFYVLIIGIFISLKLLYRGIDTDDLQLFLYPLNSIIDLAANSSSQYLPGEGYFHPALNILIDRSCSGINFMLLSFIMLGFLGIKYIESRRFRICYIVGLLPGSYLMAISVNSARILTDILLRENKLFSPLLDMNLVHKMEGMFIYLFSLILIYLLAEHLLGKWSMRHA